MTTEKNAAPEAAAPPSCFAERPQPPRTAWRFVFFIGDAPTFGFASAIGLAVELLLFSIAYVNAGWTPGVTRGGHVVLLLVVLLLVTGLRRVPVDTKDGGESNTKETT